MTDSKKPDWRWFKERTIARKRGSLASFHPLCYDCGVTLEQKVIDAKYDTHCRKCEKQINPGDLISLVIICQECSKNVRSGSIRRLDYPAQCFECGNLLSGKLDSDNLGSKLKNNSSNPKDIVTTVKKANSQLEELSIQELLYTYCESNLTSYILEGQDLDAFMIDYLHVSDYNTRLGKILLFHPIWFRNEIINNINKLIDIGKSKEENFLNSENYIYGSNDKSKNKHNITIINIPNGKEIKDNQFEIDKINSIISFEGEIVSTNNATLRLIIASYTCQICTHVQYKELFLDLFSDSKSFEPTTCNLNLGGCGRSKKETQFDFLASESVFEDFLICKIKPKGITNNYTMMVNDLDIFQTHNYSEINKFSVMLSKRKEYFFHLVSIS